jgi:hypothetical protein
MSSHRSSMPFVPSSAACTILNTLTVLSPFCFHVLAHHPFLPLFISTLILTVISLIGKLMAYDIEDEVDWSDGPLDAPSPEESRPHVGQSNVVHIANESSNSQDLFVSETADDYELPTGSSLPFSKYFDWRLAHELIWGSFRVRQTRASHTISCSACSHRRPPEPPSA